MQAQSIVSLPLRDPIACVFAVACTFETRYAVRMWYNRTCSEGFCITQEIGLYCYFYAFFFFAKCLKQTCYGGDCVCPPSVSYLRNVDLHAVFRCSLQKKTVVRMLLTV